MHQARRGSSDVEVNLTPLIDVVFLLLIFFMISTQFRAAAELELNLPTASALRLGGDAESIVVTVTRSGQYAVNQVKLPVSTEAGLVTALRDIEDLSRRGVSLEADAEATHQSVVYVLSALSKLSVEQVAIVSLPEAFQDDDN